MAKDLVDRPQARQVFDTVDRTLGVPGVVASVAVCDASGAGGQRADARGPRRLRPALGGERGGLLVADVDDVDALLAAAVVHREEVTARKGEELGDSVGLQAAGDEPAAMVVARRAVVPALGGAVVGSPERATRVAKRIRAGSISVNGGVSITGDLPFGGYKHSGMGREWGLEGIEEFLETKAIGIRAS